MVSEMSFRRKAEKWPISCAEKVFYFDLNFYANVLILLQIQERDWITKSYESIFRNIANVVGS